MKKNFPYFGVAYSQQNYGWANSSKQRAWNDGNGFTKSWGYYYF